MFKRIVHIHSVCVAIYYNTKTPQKQRKPLCYTLLFRKSDRGNGDSNLYFLIAANWMTDAYIFPNIQDRTELQFLV